MFINATLLLQMVHFGLAYYLLDRFLLHNVVTEIQQEQKNHANLLADIEAKKKKLKDQELHKKTLWDALRTLFIQYTPKNIFIVHKQKELPKKNIQEISVTKKNQEHYIKDLESFLYNKVKNVC